MNWKRFLYFDLRRLLPGHDASATEPVEPWLLRRRRRRNERRNMAFLQPGITMENYRPCPMYRLMAGPDWSGPFYFSTAHWRNALVHVMGQLESLASANANFVKGLEVAAAEEQRLRKGNRLLFFWNIFRSTVPSMVIATAAFVSCIKILEEHDAISAGLFFLIFILAVIPALFMLMRTERLEAILLALRDRMANGDSLSHAMRRMPRIFPPFICDYVQAGENCGQLPQVLRQLNDDSVRLMTQGRYIRLQFLYLGLVLAAQTLLVTFIVIKVAPVMSEMVKDMGATEPFFLRLALNLSEKEVFRFAGVAVTALLVLSWALRKLRHRPLATRLLGAPLLFVPWFRAFFVQQNLSLASFILEKLLRVGVPLDQALNTVATSDLHPLYRTLFFRVRERILGGETLSDACARESRLLPPSFRALVGVGERSGLLHESLIQLHEVYQREVEKRSRMLVDIFVPVGVLALGALTLVVEVSLFQIMAIMADTMSNPGI